MAQEKVVEQNKAVISLKKPQPACKMSRKTHYSQWKKSIEPVARR
jgi:hypothetical protein